jgi:hypothetical protein
MDVRGPVTLARPAALSLSPQRVTAAMIRLHHRTSSRRAAAVLALPFLLAAVGCGSEGTVKGTVTMDGQPLKGGGRVVFTPVQGGGQVQETIAEDGTYKAEHVPLGKVMVSVIPLTTRPPIPSFAGGGGDGKTGSSGGDTTTPTPPNIPEAYADPKTNGLPQLDVKSGVNKYDIPLKY